MSTTTNAALTTYTPAELNGDFSRSNASRTGPDTGVVAFLRSHPYYQANPALASQGIIDPTKIDAVAKNYISSGLIPTAPNGTLIPTGGAVSNSDDVIGKVDYSPTSNDRISVTLSGGTAPTLAPFSTTSYLPGYASTTSLHRYHGVVDYSRVISPSIINDLRFTA